MRRLGGLCAVPAAAVSVLLLAACSVANPGAGDGVHPAASASQSGVRVSRSPSATLTAAGRFESLTYDYSIVVPAGWTAVAGYWGNVEAESPDGTSSFFIHAERRPGESLAHIAAELSKPSSSGSCDDIRQEELTMGGEPAAMLTRACEGDMVSSRIAYIAQTVAVRDGSSFLITVYSNDEHIPRSTTAEILATFEFTD